MPEVRSRTTRPHGAPYEWRRYIDDSHPAVQKFVGWLESLAPFSRNHLLGEYEGLLELAEMGMIDHRDPPSVTRIKPVRNRPEMWELRWQMLNRKVRQYHGEPASHSGVLVALHLHVKFEPTMASGMVKSLQDAAIKYAARRYHLGRSDGWL